MPVPQRLLQFVFFIRNALSALWLRERVVQKRAAWTPSREFWQ
jgi:hypothetical protein